MLKSPLIQQGPKIENSLSKPVAIQLLLVDVVLVLLLLELLLEVLETLVELEDTLNPTTHRIPSRLNWISSICKRILTSPKKVKSKPIQTCLP